MAINRDQLDSLYDAEVVDQNGDKIGGVGQVYLDDTTEEPAWVTVKTGLFGTKETFVPLSDAQLSGERITVPYDKQHVKDAPNMDADSHLGDNEQDELYRYYGVGTGYGTTTDTSTGYADTDVDYAATGTTTDTDMDRTADFADTRGSGDEGMVLHEERANVGKERVETGRVRLRKHVVAEQKTITVPVEREEFEVVREPVGAGDTGDGRLADDAVELTLSEERPVVEKEVVATERVGLDRNVVTEERDITTDVGREEVQVERDGTTYDDPDARTSR